MDDIRSKNPGELVTEYAPVRLVAKKISIAASQRRVG